ncbi:MAG: type I-C CRISPR-associated protein Cas5 [Deltaproteobacteria bacterium RIFOXYA12_FULL_58_15]|nr:MAG: type I-C CRISPR-associated protein Cas5 [Deltaproteobacteria bacterium RIFOXYA12_FULL_58_15]OGR14278.1 MAG: type I-C CRISPR-associated protein Cas5 [Deltaproteobacteria bacterium RIFOXYB12_FULL_58_9]
MKSRTFRVRALGSLACFTRPEMKAERVSYEVMTPSAARGVLEAILWKPAIRWCIEEIAVERPIQWTSFRRNEVNSKASLRMGPYFADEDRAQRNTVALKDVSYVIAAHFVMTDRTDTGDTVTKFEEMLMRRLHKGQCFQQPFLGCREMAANVEACGDGTRQIGLTKPLGLVFYDYDYDHEPPRPLFFDARLDGGVVRVPSWDEVLVENGGAT